MSTVISRRSFLKGSAAAAAVLSSPLLPADAAFSETENGLFSPVSALCQTQYGPVKGREGENGQLCWYGIPYGAAPTGEDRWTSPREPARWRTVRDCTAPAPAAYQYTSFPLGTEDCLTLDIYSVPEAKKRPVLVYLHGSAATGSSLELPGSELVRDAGCVFVALNYRLGLFGWNCLPALTTGSDAAGNFALLDIARALDWVKENIHRSGGDADNITLCGFSDGGRMAAALAGSPLFRGRFQKAVAISGGLSLADPDAAAQKLAESIAGRKAYIPPFFPGKRMVVTTLDNLHCYTQRGTRKRKADDNQDSKSFDNQYWRMEGYALGEHKAYGGFEEADIEIGADPAVVAAEAAEQAHGGAYLKAARAQWDGLMVQWRGSPTAEPRRQAA